MGKEIVWSTPALLELEEIHTDIFEVSKSLKSADRVINEIMDSADVLSTQPEIYTLDENKTPNDGSYRSYEIRTYNVAYRVLDDTIRIIRVRYAGNEPRQY
ncbi:type II toxin-antitoxin system RelE/ParE family toxin [Aquimarina sp. 2201CG1-2-11]|uniref:type II toxin-antitoxin system RelE/ParE family toxin n=1 Tax=Aquimarina discodermiae TaxID=3231043 RepID=UPI0034626B1F